MLGIGTLTLRPQSSSPSSAAVVSGVSYRRNMFTRAAVAEVAPPVSFNRRSLYEVLKIKQNASQVEIKTAYRTLAKLYHPDTSADASSSSDGRDFIEIHNAYATLSDPEARAVYDLEMRAGSQRRRPTVSGFRSPGRSIFYPSRRWETDQCW